MKAKVFIIAIAIHILVVAGLFFLSACSTKYGPVSASGPLALEAVEQSPSLEFRAPTRPENKEDLSIGEDALADEPSSELDTAIDGGSDLEDSTADPAPEQEMVYVVESGDSLWKLSKRHGVSLDELAMANDLTRNSLLQIGQKLTIPVNTESNADSPVVVKPAAEISPAPAAEQETVIHVVQRGETPSGIAQKYGISVARLMDDNQIIDPRRMYAGGELKIQLVESRIKPANNPLNN